MVYYMKSLSRELASEGIRVNTVSPGTTFVPGGWWDRVRSSAPQIFESTRTSTPMGRLGSGEEIARVVAFISSPAASYVAGANWFVDGAESVPAFPQSPSEARIRQRGPQA
jgi:NAD(P)-dependent dehydrogenase (short-subunit alcohol dehydrogenase family)